MQPSAEMCETASCVLQRNKHDNLDLIVLLYAICLLSAAVLLFISSLWSSPKRNSIIIETTPRGEAGAQVANTFELLEGILLRLPMSEIVSAQEVNKQFKNVINNSHRLQRAVFKKPAVIPTNAASHPQPQLNPLLFLRFGNVLGNVSIKRINHFWIWKARHGLYKQEEEFIRLCTEDTVLLYLKHEGEAEDELSEESWSGMYLTQPPCDVELGVEEQEGEY